MLVNFKKIIKLKLKENKISFEEANLIINSICEIMLENKFNDQCLENLSLILQQLLNANLIARKGNFLILFINNYLLSFN